MIWCLNAKFLFWSGIWRKIIFLGFKSLNFVILTSWLVLIFAFKWHHVFKTFLDHVHLHWVLKTYFKLFFYIKFLDFKSFKLYIVRPIEPYIRLIENVQFLGQKSLSGSILAQLMLDQSKFPRKFFIYWCSIPLDQSNFKNFFFSSSYLINLFMHHLYLNSHALHLGIFFWDMVDNKCANIFSNLDVDLSSNTLTHEKTSHAEFLYYWDLYCIVLINCVWNVCTHLFMGHIVSTYMCLFIFPYLLNFSQNCFSNLLCL